MAKLLSPSSLNLPVPPLISIITPRSPYFANMVGQITYPDEQIIFVLESIRDGWAQDTIMATYTKKFGNSFTANQLRYVKNKYGKDPKFGYASVLRKLSLMCFKPWSEVKLTKR